MVELLQIDRTLNLVMLLQAGVAVAAERRKTGSAWVRELWFNYRPENPGRVED